MTRFYVDAPAEEQRREVCVLSKGYVAWKSHTDHKKWRSNCDMPFSVVAPLWRCVSGIWDGEMRSAIRTAHFFIHFGVRERACPEEGNHVVYFLSMRPPCHLFKYSHGKLLHHSFFLCKLSSTTEPTLWIIVRMESENIWKVLFPISVIMTDFC